jgi:hypothetical protein
MEYSQSNSGLDQCHNCGVRRKQVANPTTNYGFVLPTPTDLVTDLPADFDVALQGVDTRLKALQPGTTLGDLAYSSATANTNTRLAIGSTGNVLTVSGGVPTWAAPAGGGGKVLQVVSASTKTSTAITSLSMTDSTITATITPTLASSKIFVIVSAATVTSRSANESRAQAQLLRGATKIADYNTESFFGGQFTSATSFFMNAQNSITYLDSPATTSATTYKLQGSVNSTGGSQTLTFQYNSSQSTITLMEIGA